MQIDTKIFKEYDIRGIFPDQLNKELAFKIGQALVFHFNAQEIAVGRDARASGHDLFDGLTQGIMSMGSNVIDLGMVTTDMAWFSSGKYKFPLTVMITASHNPPEWNGFKMVTAGAVGISLETGLNQIKNLIETEGGFEEYKQKGSILTKNIMDDWVAHSLSFIHKNNLKPLKVVVDASNGSGGEQVKESFEDLPFTLIEQYFEPDGRFPNHLSETTKEENLTQVKERVLKENADVGFMFDGDADRIALIDEKGNTVSGTIVTALISKLLLEKYPGETILYNPTVGRAVPELVQKLGGKALRVRTGNMLIKQAMREHNAIFAGETSYHFFFRENYYADTGLITMLVLLELFSKDGRPVSEIVKEYDIYSQSGDINFTVENKASILQSIKEDFTDADSIDELDGVTVWYKDWWFNLRPSNTENLVRLNIEADTKELLDEKIDKMVKYIESLDGTKK